MRITFTPSAWDDYMWFQENDRKMMKRINLLIRECARTPFDGIGKPEPLKGELSGHWSRRITQEHRLVYASTADALVIISCRYHYEK